MARTSEFSLPLELHEHLSMIQPTTAFHRSSRGLLHSQEADADSQIHLRRTVEHCDSKEVTPVCLESLYRASYNSRGKSGIAVFAYDEYAASHSDAKKFLHGLSSGSRDGDFQTSSLDGKDRSYKADPDPNDLKTGHIGKGNLDTQYALALGFPNAVTLWSRNGETSRHVDGLLQFAQSMNLGSFKASVATISFGGDESKFPPSYAQALCTGE
jgi:tripeptidyl-peptidase-1